MNAAAHHSPQQHGWRRWATLGAAATATLLAIPMIAASPAQALTPLEVTVAVNNHTYDGTDTATITGCTIDTDTTGVFVACDATGASGFFLSADAGTAISVNVSGLALTGADAASYEITTINAAADIHPATVSATAVSADSRDYDATTGVNISDCTLSGVIAPDDVTCSGSGSFDSSAVGTGKAVTVDTLSLGGIDAANYTLDLPYPTGATADVTAIDLTVDAIDADSKNYDGNADAVISDCTLNGVLGEDDVTCSGTGSFDTPAAGTGKTVTAATLTLGGAEAGNYNLTGTYPTDTAAIDPIVISATAVVIETKEYDGTTDANVASCTLDGVIGSDVVSCTGDATFDDANAGTSKAVTVDTLTLEGADNGNYTLDTDYPAATGDITPVTLTVTPDDQTITYGDPVPAAGFFTFNVNGFVNGESTSAGSYIAPECTTDYVAGDPAGSYDITCTGGSMDNYEFAYDTATLTVDPLAVPSDAVWYTGPNEKYTSSATETLTKVTLSATLSLELIDEGAGQECGTDTAISVADATITFTDQISGKILAKDVRVSEVAGNCEEGIATAIVTLSTGNNGTELYVIVSTVGGSMSASSLDTGGQIDTDLASAKVAVSQPRPLGTLQGFGELTVIAKTGNYNLGTAGSLTTTMGGDAASATFRFVPGTRKVLPKGQTVVVIPAADGGFYVIKSNSINSVIVGTTITSVNTKASVSLVGGTCVEGTCAIEGGVSLRLDVTNANQSLVGYTVQSTKTSTLLYSNNWYKTGRTWTTMAQLLS